MVRLEQEVKLKKHRMHMQIATEILDKCLRRQGKTGIMYSVALNHKMVNNYLSELQQAKLLEASHFPETKYVTTEKGREYLKKYRELQKIADLSPRGINPLKRNSSTK